MALTGRLDADFGPFLAAVDAAETKLRSFESSSSKVQSQLDRMVDGFSGRKVISDATLMSEAVERVGGVSTLTASELQRVGTTAQEAVEKFRALGQDVPPGIQNIADRARGAAEETLRLGEGAGKTADSFKEWAGKIDIKGAISDPIGTAKGGMLAFAETLGPTGVALAGVTAAGIAVGTTLFKLATDAAAVGGALDDMADKTGMSVPALSKLSNATQVIGADMGSLTDVVFKLQRGLGDNTAAFQEGLSKMGLSTAELRAAGPDDYLQMITAGLQSISEPSARAAAGAAVLGKGYKDVAASLADLDAGFKATADLSPWTAAQAAEAEHFEQQIASLTTHVEAAAIAFGQQLIPAASLFVDAVTRIGTAIVNVSGIPGYIELFHVLTGALGETALAEQSLGASMDTANHLFAEHGATSTTVAQKMLELGYSQQTVAMHTGLAAAAIKTMAGELKAATIAAADYDSAWEAINAAYEKGVPSITGVSASTRALVADLQAMGITIPQITAATGLSAAQQLLLTKAHADGETAAKKYNDAIKELTDVTGSTDEIVDTLSGDMVEAIKYYLAAGKSQETLTAALMGTATQIKAVADQVKAAEDAYKLFIKTEEAGAAQLAKHAQELRASQNKHDEELLKGQADNYKTMTELRAKYDDMILKSSTDATTYQITKIWQKAQAEVDAFDQTDERYQEHTDLVYTLAEAEARGLTDVMAVAVDSMASKAEEGLDRVVSKAQAASYSVNSMFSVGGSAEDMQAKADRLGGTIAKDDYGNPYVYIPGVNQPGRRAAGGPVDAGQPYWTGERGPELFVPSTAGSIVPHGGGGATVNATIFVNGTAEDVARKVAAEIMRQIKAGQQLGTT